MEKPLSEKNEQLQKKLYEKLSQAVQDPYKVQVGLGRQYFHIYNSGVVFEVTCNRHLGPRITVSTSTFGNLCNTMSIRVDRDALQRLAKLFKQASQGCFGQVYCHAAKSTEKDTGQMTFQQIYRQNQPMNCHLSQFNKSQSDLMSRVDDETDGFVGEVQHGVDAP